MSKSSQPSTQEHLPVAGIQDGVLIMNDGSVRAVLKVDPINFELKSETEQNAIIYSYQAFLNSLEFPIQIVIQSKKLDLERYLIKLEQAQGKMQNELMRIQVEDYVGFVRRLISIANIMSKRFYVVVSFAAVTQKSGLRSLTGIFSHAPKGPLLDQDQFDRFRTEVYNRGNIIGAGLGRIGLKVSFLDTQQLIELFYGIYNPDIATEERLTDVGSLNAGVVSSPNLLKPEEAAPAGTESGQETPAPTTQDATTQPTPSQPTDSAPPAAGTDPAQSLKQADPLLNTFNPVVQPSGPAMPSPSPAPAGPPPAPPVAPPR